MQCFPILVQKYNFNTYCRVKMALSGVALTIRVAMIIMLMVHSLREALPHQNLLGRIVDNYLLSFWPRVAFIRAGIMTRLQVI